MDRLHHGSDKREFAPEMAFAGRVRELYAESAPLEKNYRAIYGASLHMNDRDRVLFAHAIRAELGRKHQYFEELADQLVRECDPAFDAIALPENEDRRERTPGAVAFG